MPFAAISSRTFRSAARASSSLARACSERSKASAAARRFAVVGDACDAA